MQKTQKRRVKKVSVSKLHKPGKLSAVLHIILLAIALSVVSAYAADKMIIKDATGNIDVFKVNNDGTMYISDGGPTPGYDATRTRAIISNTSDASDRTYLSLIAGETTGISRINFGDPDSENVGFFSYSHSNNSMQVRAGGIEVMRFVNNKMSIGGEVSPDNTLSVKGGVGIGSTYSGTYVAPSDGMIVEGAVGIGTPTPSYPLEMGSGARVTVGGVWEDASSIKYKENVEDLSSEDAIKALTELNPVTYNYKVDGEETRVGFIAEVVPELVATKERKTLSSMDIVAVLTKVVKEQQKTISELKETVSELQREVKLKGKLAMNDNIIHYYRLNIIYP